MKFSQVFDKNFPQELISKVSSIYFMLTMQCVKMSGIQAYFEINCEETERVKSKD